MINRIHSNYKKVRIIPFSANKNGQEDKHFIFTAMPMPNDENRPKWDKINKTIQETAHNAGTKAGKVDNIMEDKIKKYQNLPMIDVIEQEIKNSDFVVADVTEKNPNVYFELGLARGLGKTVVPIAEKGTKLPFDISNLWTVFYENPQDLEQKLGKRLNLLLDNNETKQVL